MNKKILLLLLCAFCLSANAQKSKKPAKTKTATTTAKKTTLAKAETLSAELLEKKDNYKFYLLAGKDSILIKNISGKIGTNVPTECKITPFTTKGAKLYSVSWIERNTVGDAKSKLENITETHTEIWDVPNKAQLYANTQMVDNISEIVWLDPNKTASKTVEKIRRDGFELTLLPDGDINIKNKTMEDKLTYDAAQKKYVSAKKK
ncbi:MAG TPA: hypothetical protein VK623_02395 [Flavobacterium sp.]|nr:hypothetical protein [Flavobacterium sp.]